MLAHGSISSHLTAQVEMAPVAEYANCHSYSLTPNQLNRKYYNDAKRGINEFSSKEEKEQLSMHCSRNHIWVKYNPTGAMSHSVNWTGTEE